MKQSYIWGYSLAFLATLICICFFDRSIAVFAYEHEMRSPLFEVLTLAPEVLQGFTALLLIVCIRKHWRDRFGSLVIQLLCALSLAWVVRIAAKFVFGRTWPDTWTGNNPSWLQNGIEGFFPFSGGIAYNSFPSGHSLITFALASVLWQLLPRYRWLWSFLSVALIVGMLGQYYHYLGDLLAGATLGTLCGHFILAMRGRFNERLFTEAGRLTKKSQ